MKAKLLCAVALVAVLAIPSIARANLLQNSGFESWTFYGGSEVPVNWWHMFDDTDLTGTKESTIKQSGAYSGKIDKTGAGWGGWGQEVQGISYGDTLYAYQPLYISSDMSNAKATLEITFKEYDGGPVTGGPYKTSRISATSGWEALEWSGAVPASTGFTQYVVLLEDAGGAPQTGIAYFDNAYADTQPIPEPNTLLLLGTGLVGLMSFIKRKRN